MIWHTKANSGYGMLYLDRSLQSVEAEYSALKNELPVLRTENDHLRKV